MPGLRSFIRPARIASLIAALAAVLVGNGGAAAHEGSSGLSVNVASANPGALVEVRGDDVGAARTIELLLVGDSGMARLDRIAVGPDGHFTVIVQLPADAPEGVYELQAVVGDAVLASTAVGIRGQPMVPGGDDDLAPDFVEGQPAVGSGSGGAVPTIPPLIDETRSSATPADGWAAAGPVVLGVLVLVALAAVVYVRMTRGTARR